MAFHLLQMIEWLREAALPYRVLRADGSTASADQDVAIHTVEFDSRDAGSGVLFCAVPGARTHGVRFLADALRAGTEAALVEGEAPPIGSSTAIVIETPDARAALNAAARGWLARHRPRVVAITGSNGKTTTKDLTAAALRGSLRVSASPGNRNSGWGLPAAILGCEGQAEVLVLEMGASAPGEIERLCAVAPPSLACITNVGPAHLEFFGSEEEVAQTKGAIVASLREGGVAVLNRDDRHFEALAVRAESARARVVSFGQDAHADFRVERVASTAGGLGLSVNGHSVVLPLFGEHNALNVAAAAALASELGVELSVALHRMEQVRMSPHRSRMLEIGGRTFLDDTYNANPASVTAALDSLARQPGVRLRVAVLGDMGELGTHSPAAHREVIAHALADAGLSILLVVGEAMTEAARHFDDPRLRSSRTIDARTIAGTLIDTTQPGDAVLLKASRSVALERVLECFELECSEGPSAPGGLP